MSPADSQPTLTAPAHTRTHAHAPHMCMHAHSHTCQIVALAISPLPSFLLLISRREGGSMKNEWLPYGSGRLRKKREAIGVENQFRQVADI